MNLKQLMDFIGLHENSPINIILPSGSTVPEHFHITEVGKVHKTFVDCGGSKRESVTCLMQIWTATDTDHRLNTTKLEKILSFAKEILGNEDMPVEFEYGDELVVQYKLEDVVMASDVTIDTVGLLFVLGAKETQCLAPDKCGVSSCCPTGCC